MQLHICIIILTFVITVKAKCGLGYQEWICNDMEMFYQCNRAQTILDAFTLKSNLPFYNLGCHKHIVCAAKLSEGRYWCQNMDSYNLCLSGRDIIAYAVVSDKYPIECRFDVLLEDRIPVLNFTKPKVFITVSKVTSTSSKLDILIVLSLAIICLSSIF